MLGNPFAIPRQAAQDIAEEFATVRDVTAIPVSVHRSVHVDQDHVVIVCNNNQEASIPKAGLEQALFLCGGPRPVFPGDFPGMANHHKWKRYTFF